jgi:hypothetical protein
MCAAATWPPPRPCECPTPVESALSVSSPFVAAQLSAVVPHFRRYRTARDAGLRESGIVPAADFPLCALRSTALTMDAVVGENGKWLVDPAYLQFSVRLAQQKMLANLAKLVQLEQRLRLDLLMFSAGPASSSDTRA